MKPENYSASANDVWLIDAYDMYECIDKINPSVDAVKQFIKEYQQSGRYSPLGEYLIKMAIKKLDSQDVEKVFNGL